MNTLLDTLQYFVFITIELIALFMLISAAVEIILMYIGKSSVRCPLKPKRFYPLKIFNNAPSKSLDRWGYYYFSLFPSVCRHLPDTFSV